MLIGPRLLPVQWGVWHACVFEFKPCWYRSHMVLAVKLFISRSDECDVISLINGQQWMDILITSGSQRMVSKNISRLYVQVANSVNVRANKVGILWDSHHRPCNLSWINWLM